MSKKFDPNEAMEHARKNIHGFCNEEPDDELFWKGVEHGKEMMREEITELKKKYNRLFSAAGAFKGFIEGDVEERMIQWWMYDERCSRKQAIEYYYDDSFPALCERLKSECVFIKDDKRTCFEVEDNNFIIPINIINVTGFIGGGEG